jgi:hypothetical protein
MITILLLILIPIYIEGEYIGDADVVEYDLSEFVVLIDEITPNDIFADGFEND